MKNNNNIKLRLINKINCYFNSNKYCYNNNNNKCYLLELRMLEMKEI